LNLHCDNSKLVHRGDGSAAAIKSDMSDDDSERSPDQDAARLEGEIEAIRDKLGGLVRELDHRRHRLNPLNAVARNPWPFAVGGAMLLGCVVGGVVWHRAREREQAVWSGNRLLRQVRRRDPGNREPVVQRPLSLGVKVLTAAAAAVMARRLVGRLVAQTP
jgi:hypothetical protein